MGFMDKAKKMAEQAQQRIDEVQKGFNEGQGSSQSQGPVTEYDKHGRPVPSADAAPPPPPPPPAPEAATAPPPAPPAPPAPPSPPAPAAPQAAGDGEYAPPTLTSGDPLAG